MLIELDQPFTVGDLNPETGYDHVYVTLFHINGPALLATVTYEVGTFTPDMPLGSWQKAAEVPTRTLSISGENLFPFFLTLPTDTVRPLWDQVEELLYAQIQEADARLAGTIRALGVPHAD